jgi:metallo-beta-lactamase family protein
MLPDAGSIQETEVAMLNRRNAARGRAEVSPIYTQADAVATLDAFQAVEYETWFQVMPGVRARYWNAGHLLGSASIELEFANEGISGQPLLVLASGDIGPDAKLFQPEPKAPTGLDYVIAESTYGDEDRPAVTREARRRGARCPCGWRRASYSCICSRADAGADRGPRRFNGSWRSAGCADLS